MTAKKLLEEVKDFKGIVEYDYGGKYSMILSDTKQVLELLSFYEDLNDVFVKEDFNKNIWCLENISKSEKMDKIALHFIKLDESYFIKEIDELSTCSTC